MTKARSQQVSLDTTPYYHCVSRCVRRAWLCGEQYEHRREWVESRLLTLAEVFCIDVAAYAVMSNHYHVVLHVNHTEAMGLEVPAVIARWHRLFKGNLLSQKYLRGDPMSPAEKTALDTVVETWRSRLHDISWFMRLVNEHIARQANAEDQCTGRFWEGRFKSQALLDDQALAACMAYVDLNPVRAGMAETPEQSDHTSIQRRADRAQGAAQANHPYQQPRELMPFAGNPRASAPDGLPFRLTDYLALVDWTGRQVKEGKRGFIFDSCPAILERLSIEPAVFYQQATAFEHRFSRLAGSISGIKKAVKAFGYRRMPAVRVC